MDGHVYVVDSENACLGQGLLVRYAAMLRERGLTAAEIAAELDRKKKDIRLIALLDTLEYLKKGGRISSAAALVGGMLSIKPVISVEGGEVKLLGKARGSRNGNNLLTQLIGKTGGINFSMPFCLGYSGLSDRMLQKYISDSSEIYVGHCDAQDIPICTIGSTIGTHVGPGAIGAAFFVNE